MHSRSTTGPDVSESDVPASDRSDGSGRAVPATEPSVPAGASGSSGAGQRPERGGAESAGRRALWIAVVALLLGAGALWGASGLVWIEVPRGLTVEGRMVEDLTGSDLVQWPVPIALLALAAVAATLASRGMARRILGGLLVVAGVWTAYLALGGDVGEVEWTGWAPGYEGASGRPERTVRGPAAAVAGGVLVACAGTLLVAKGHRMARMGAKYTAPGTRRTTRDPDTELWDALSEGSDPTESTERAAGPERGGSRPNGGDG